MPIAVLTELTLTAVDALRGHLLNHDVDDLWQGKIRVVVSTVLNCRTARFHPSTILSSLLSVLSVLHPLKTPCGMRKGHIYRSSREEETGVSGSDLILSLCS